jgi:asparagine synthase (glutamine-hydrolysing)
MCGIAGFVNHNAGYLKQREKYVPILEAMNQRQKHRGPCSDGIFLDNCCGFAHVRLSILDLEGGSQPMHCYENGQRYSIIYNGEIYNMPSLRAQLEKEGVFFDTTSDTEVILKGYCRHGKDFFRELNGIFAFAIWEHKTRRLTLVRDRLGVKPLFYTLLDNTLIFSSEIKGLFCYPAFRPVVSATGLCELLALGPAHTCGRCVYDDVTEVFPGHYLVFEDSRIVDEAYWTLEGKTHTDSISDTIDHTRFLVEDSVRMQMLSDIPICTFLSGGLDSSVVSAICAAELKKKGLTLSTYSFDFVNNQQHYVKNSFQPTLDAPYAQLMANYIESRHTELFCDNIALADYLEKAVDGRDFPCMADVESSLCYFCERVSKNHKVTLTGECADEIFGGYPWFYKQELFDRNDFPWSSDMETRSSLLNDSLLKLPLYEYSHDAYTKTISETPVCDTDNETEKRRRELQYLNLRWFMATLLERMDRTSMQSGLEARVPFADHRIVEYLYNVPWELKSMGNQEKGLLRKAMEGILPDSVLYRKKSPYPKTYNPAYEALLKTRFKKIIETPDSPILTLIDVKKAQALIDSKLEYTRPWYGQLMAGPQLIAYFIQINYWLSSVKPALKI